MNQKIRILVSPNEKGSARMKEFIKIVADDPRFLLPEFEETDADLMFESDDYKRAINIELKLSADYIASALSGHLYMQCLTLRESGLPCWIIVLGSDADVSEAVKLSLQTRYRGQELGYNIASYESRLIDFESQSEALGCPVRRWKSQPWKRLLSMVHKVLLGGSLMQYVPRPADHEREATALCMAKGIGEKTAFALMADYGSIANLCTASLEDLASFKQDGRRIGQKKAEAIINLLHSERPSKDDPHIKERR